MDSSLDPLDPVESFHIPTRPFWTTSAFKAVLATAFISLTIPFSMYLARRPTRPAALAASSGITTVYSDSLSPNWQNWSWSSAVNLSATSPVYSGTHSISWDPQSWGGLKVHTTQSFISSSSTILHFAIRSTQVGQRFNLRLSDGTTVYPVLSLANLPTNTWKVFDIPLSSMSAVGKRISEISIQDRTGLNQPAVYLDDIYFTDSTSPTPTPTPIPSIPPASNRTVYADGLAPYWSQWSYISVVNLSVSSPVYVGNASLSWDPQAWGTLELNTSQPFVSAASTGLHFAIRSSQTGQKFNLWLINGSTSYTKLSLTNLPVNTWKVFDIPLSSLSAAGKNITGISLQDRTGLNQPAVYLDDIYFTDSTSPTPVPSPTPISTPTPTPIPGVTPTPTPRPTPTPTPRPTPTPTPRPTATPTPPPTSGYWIPRLTMTYQIQYNGTLDTSIASDVYDVDLFDTPAQTFTNLHAQGKKIICYLSAGSWEDWRPDANSFPAQVLGNDYEGWPGERWLDIRRIDLLGPIMINRLNTGKQKGCDAIDPDNINGYTNNTGFPLTYADQKTFNIWLALQAHQLGMSIGLKNNPEQIADLLSYYDFSVIESCYRYNECNLYSPFATAGKVVYQIEYTDDGSTTAAFCPAAKTRNFTAFLKHRNLDAWIQRCP